MREVIVLSTAHCHLRSNHTFTVTPYEAKTQVTKTQVKSWLIVLQTTQSISNAAIFTFRLYLQIKKILLGTVPETYAVHN